MLHACHGGRDGDRGDCLLVPGKDRGLKDDVLARLASLQERASCVVSAEAVADAVIVVFKGFEVVSRCGGQADSDGVDLARLEHVVGLQQGLSLVPAQYLGVIVVPLGDTRIKGGGSAHDGMVYVGIRVGYDGGRLILCRNIYLAIKAGGNTHRKGQGGKTGIGRTDQGCVIEDLPVLEHFSLGIGPLVGNQGKYGAGKEGGFKGLHAVRKELTARYVEGHKNRIQVNAVGVGGGRAVLMAVVVQIFAVYRDHGVVGHTVAVNGNDAECASVLDVGLIGVGGEHFMRDLLLVIIIPLVDHDGIQGIIGDNGGNGSLTDHDGRHDALDGIQGSGPDGLAGHALAVDPPARIVMVVGNVPILGDPPHQEYLALGGFVGLEVDSRIVEDVADLVGEIVGGIGLASGHGNQHGEAEGPCLLFVARNVAAVRIGFGSVHGDNGFGIHRVSLCGNDLELHHVGITGLKGIRGGEDGLPRLVQVEFDENRGIFLGICGGDLNGGEIACLGGRHREGDLGQDLGKHGLHGDGFVSEIEVGLGTAGRVDRDVARADHPSHKALAGGGIVCQEMHVLGQALGDLLGVAAVGVRLTADDGNGDGELKVVLPPGQVSVQLLTVEVDPGVAVGLIPVGKSDLECDIVGSPCFIYVLGSEIGVGGLVQRSRQVAVPVFFGLLGDQLKGGVSTHRGDLHCESQFLQGDDLGIHCLQLHVTGGHLEGGALAGGILQHNVARKDVPANKGVSAFGVMGGDLNDLAQVCIGDLAVVIVYRALSVLDGYDVIRKVIDGDQLHVLGAHHKGGGACGLVCEGYAAARDLPFHEGLPGNRLCNNGDLVTHDAFGRIGCAARDCDGVYDVCVGRLNGNISEYVRKGGGRRSCICQSALAGEDDPLLEHLARGRRIGGQGNGILNGGLGDGGVVYGGSAARNLNRVLNGSVQGGDLHGRGVHDEGGGEACGIRENDLYGIYRPAREHVSLFGRVGGHGNGRARHGLGCVGCAVVDDDLVSGLIIGLDLHVSCHHFKGGGGGHGVGKGNADFEEITPLQEALPCLGRVGHKGHGGALRGGSHLLVSDLGHAAHHGNGEFEAVGGAGVVIGQGTDLIIYIRKTVAVLHERYAVAVPVGPIQFHFANSAQHDPLPAGNEDMLAIRVVGIGLNRNTHVARGVDDNVSLQGVQSGGNGGIQVGRLDMEACLIHNPNVPVGADADGGRVCGGIILGGGDGDVGAAVNGHAVSRSLGVREAAAEIVLNTNNAVGVGVRVDHVQGSAALGGNDQITAVEADTAARVTDGVGSHELDGQVPRRGGGDGAAVVILEDQNPFVRIKLGYPRVGGQQSSVVGHVAESGVDQKRGRIVQYVSVNRDRGNDVLCRGGNQPESQSHGQADKGDEYDVQKSC